MERVGGSEELDFAIDTALRAGRLLCEFFERKLTVRSKSSAIDLVTEADTASEALIVEALRARFPQYRILSEEGLGDLASLSAGPVCGSGDDLSRPSARLWTVDPLDGTVNYAHGYPIWAVAIALAVDGKVELAVTVDPMRGDVYWAEQGRGAWKNRRRMRVSKAPVLARSLLATGFAYSRATDADNNLAEFNALMPRVHGVRRAGSAALDLAHVAGGWLDGYWEKHLRPWDWAGGWLLVEEAGGKVTDLEGRPWSLDGAALVASNGRVHAELLKALGSAHRS